MINHSKKNPNGQKTTPRYKEAEAKQEVAGIHILDNIFYLLIVLYLGSELPWNVNLEFFYRLQNCMYSKISCFEGSIT